MNDTPTIEVKQSTLPIHSKPILPSVARETALTTTQRPKRRSTSLALVLLAAVLAVAVIGWYSFRGSRTHAAARALAVSAPDGSDYHAICQHILAVWRCEPEHPLADG